MRRHVIFAATFIGGLFFIATFILGDMHPSGFKAAEDAVLKVIIVLGTFSFCMGLVSIGSVHGKRLVYQRKGWPYSLALFLGLFIAITVGLVAHYAGDGFWDRFNKKIIFEGLIIPLSSTMFSLLAFYVVSASFRAFRIRSAEAGLMMAAALVVMFAQMPLVQVNVPASVSVKQWILEVVNAGAQRAIMIGSGLAGLVVGLRIWLGIERGSFFEQQ